MERVRAEDGRELAVIERELLGVGDDETNAFGTGRQLGRRRIISGARSTPTTRSATALAAREAAPDLQFT